VALRCCALRGVKALDSLKPEGDEQIGIDIIRGLKRDFQPWRMLTKDSISVRGNLNKEWFHAVTGVGSGKIRAGRSEAISRSHNCSRRSTR
jgi:hypothetical protein